MPRLDHTVDVAASPETVRVRLADAAVDPTTVVRWFTDDEGVRATVVDRGDDRWRVDVRASTFEAEVDVAVSPRGPGARIRLRGDLRGRGLLRFASPALAAAVPAIERQATETLHAEFGDPDGPVDPTGR